MFDIGLDLEGIRCLQSEETMEKGTNEESRLVEDDFLSLGQVLEDLSIDAFFPKGEFDDKKREGLGKDIGHRDLLASRQEGFKDYHGLLFLFLQGGEKRLVLHFAHKVAEVSVEALKPDTASFLALCPEDGEIGDDGIKGFGQVRPHGALIEGFPFLKVESTGYRLSVFEEGEGLLLVDGSNFIYQLLFIHNR